MKVITGTARGRTIQAPRSGRLRITSDRVKEALFNILGPVRNLNVADIFAGSGNVGIEAFSRGAAKVCFVEIDRNHLATIRKNIERCGFIDGVEIIAGSFDQAVARLGQRRERYDIIFADPPYDQDLVDRTLRVLAANPILAPDGIIVIEHSSREACTDSEEFVVEDQRVYGDTVLTFLKNARQGESHE